MSKVEIPGGYGHAFELKTGEAIRLVNTHGTQVVDTWALAAHDTSEFLSVEATRRMLFSLFPVPGKPLYSNRRNPMLMLEEDSSGCQHDMLFAACDKWLYKHYGCAPGHRNCQDNFREALFAIGRDPSFVPSPVNLWMNIPVTQDSKLGLEPPVSKAGDHVALRALMDVVVIFSACPMDVTPINGPDRTLRPVHAEVLRS
jgi:uncharacterized protein YcgI (DUF1989 family)